MATFSTDQVVSLIQSLGGNSQQAQQVLGQLDHVDTDQHADLLNQLGVDPNQLASGGYQQQLGDVANKLGSQFGGQFGGGGQSADQSGGGQFSGGQSGDQFGGQSGDQYDQNN
jgi:hypothetical protein